MITVRSTINLAHQSVPEVIPAVQGDTGRSILFSLADFTIPEGATARYFITKPSGLAVYNDATIDGNTVLVDLTAQSLAEYGDCPGQVRIMLGQTVVTSFEFILHVEPFRGIDAVESTTETNIFDKAVEDAREAIAEAAEEAEEYISQALDTTLTIPDKAADAKATGDAISDSADAVIAQMRAEIANVYPTETAQGNPASFDDGADEIPVKDLKVSIVPNQDLHGYDKPWAGGAGKNLLPMTVAGIKTSTAHVTWNGNSFTYAGITATIKTDDIGNVLGILCNGTSTDLFYMNLGQYTFTSGTNVCMSGGVTTGKYLVVQGQVSLKDIGSGLVINTLNEAKQIQLVILSGQTCSNEVFYPQIELGSSKTAFAPYTNLCPITGMTEVEVKRTGKNLIPMTVAGIKAGNTSGTWSGNAYTRNGVTFTLLTDSDGNVTGIKVNGTATDLTNLVLTDITFTNGVSYVLNGAPSGSSSGSYFLSATIAVDYGSGATFTGDGELRQARISVQNGVAVNTTFYPMIRLASDTDATFEPYHTPQTVTTDLGRTVYGGTLDVTTGVLTVDRAIITYDGSDDENWSAIDSNRRVKCISPFPTNIVTPSSASAIFDGLSNQYPAVSSNDTYLGTMGISVSVGRFDVSDGSGAMNLADFKAYIAENPLMICYELATPQTYTLTPQELLSVLGTNHISTDAESVEVVYRQDIGLILKRMSDSLLPYLPLTRDGIYDLKAEVTGGEKSLYWWTRAFSMMSSARPMQTPIADEPVEELEEEPMDDIEENEEE